MKIIMVALLLSLGNSVSASPDKNFETIIVSVTKKGFEPSSINVKPGTSVVLKITRKTDSTCAKEIVIPSKKIEKDLPLDKEVVVQLGKLEKGEIKFSCGMSMIEGRIHVK